MMKNCTPSNRQSTTRTPHVIIGTYTIQLGRRGRIKRKGKGTIKEEEKRRIRRREKTKR